MKKQFSTEFLGYDKKQVDRRIEELTRDYEEELSKKMERLRELAEENRRLKQEAEEKDERIARFIEQEKYISRALIKAEQRAQAIIEEGQRKSLEEVELLRAEKEKWREKFREVRSELLEFEQAIMEMMEKFRDEINYYTAKEISETILMDDDSEMDIIKKVIA
jgi:colicin import membrane protein